jgi:hypothetical protein
MTCAVAGCESPVLVKKRMLCRRHYRRWQRHGDPTAGRIGEGAPLIDRFQQFAVRMPSGCIDWVGARSRGGYGHLKVAGKTLKAHRVAYELFVGPIPEGMEIDHRCRNKYCVNTAHLEAVTRSENVRRGWPFRRGA